MEDTGVKLKRDMPSHLQVPGLTISESRDFAIHLIAYHLLQPDKDDLNIFNNIAEFLTKLGTKIVKGTQQKGYKDLCTPYGNFIKGYYSRQFSSPSKGPPLTPLKCLKEKTVSLNVFSLLSDNVPDILKYMVSEAKGPRLTKIYDMAQGLKELSKSELSMIELFLHHKGVITREQIESLNQSMTYEQLLELPEFANQDDFEEDQFLGLEPPTEIPTEDIPSEPFTPKPVLEEKKSLEPVTTKKVYTSKDYLLRVRRLNDTQVGTTSYAVACIAANLIAEYNLTKPVRGTSSYGEVGTLFTEEHFDALNEAYQKIITVIPYITTVKFMNDLYNKPFNREKLESMSNVAFSKISGIVTKFNLRDEPPQLMQALTKGVMEQNQSII